MKKFLLSLLVLLTFATEAKAAMQDGPNTAWPNVIIGGSVQNFVALNGAGERFGYIFVAPKTGSLTGILFRTVTVTTGATVDVRLETVGTDGFPTGTLVGTNTNITQVIADADDNTNFDVTFTSAASVTIGTKYALVLGVSSGTPSALGIGQYGTAQGALLAAIPWTARYISSAWAYDSTNSVMVGALKYSGPEYPYSPAFVPGVYTSSTTFNNTSTPDVRALRFNFPTPKKVCGLWGNIDLDGTGVLKLYDSDGVTVLASYDFDDADYPPTPNARTPRIRLTSPVTLAKSTNYRLGFEPSSATNAAIGELTLMNSSVYTATAHETYGIMSTAKDPSGVGSWTDSAATVMPQLGLIFCGDDDGVSTSASPSVSYQ